MDDDTDDADDADDDASLLSVFVVLSAAAVSAGVGEKIVFTGAGDCDIAERVIFERISCHSLASCEVSPLPRVRVPGAARPEVEEEEAS